MKDFSYPEVGATLHDELPPGYHHLRYSEDIDVPFATAANRLLTFDMHRAAGLRPDSTASRAAEGVELTNRLGPLRAPCRVVWMEDEPARAGFAYGTLRGHPECGEEIFRVDDLGDGRTRFTVASFSRPARWYTKLAGPIVPLVQAWVVRRFAGALRRAWG